MRYLRVQPWFVATMGPAGIQSGDGEGCYSCTLGDPFADVELGIIAGCLPLDPVSWWLVPWPHDGRITVDSSRHGCTVRDHITMPLSHDMLVLSPIAHYQTLHFLREGRFLRLTETAAAEPVALQP